MKEAIIQILMAGIGALGFSIYFRVSEKNIIASSIGGMLGWALYLVMFKLTGGLFASNFASALFVYFYSELMARLLKAPSNVYLVPGIIPLIPGSALYYTMSGIVSENSRMFTENAVKTIQVTFGIAFGIVVGTVVVMYITRLISKIKAKNSRQAK